MLSEVDLDLPPLFAGVDEWRTDSPWELASLSVAELIPCDSPSGDVALPVVLLCELDLALDGVLVEEDDDL